MAPERSRRFENLPGYPLTGIPEVRKRLEAAGVDIIDLGVGDADLDPPPRPSAGWVKLRLNEACRDTLFRLACRTSERLSQRG